VHEAFDCGVCVSIMDKPTKMLNANTNQSINQSINTGPIHKQPSRQTDANAIVAVWYAEDDSACQVLSTGPAHDGKWLAAMSFQKSWG
jgi:hypothetical protein